MVRSRIHLTQFPRAQCKRGNRGAADAVSGARSKAPAEYLANLVENAGPRQTSAGAGLFRLDTATQGDNYQAVGEVHVSLERTGTSERAK